MRIRMIEPEPPDMNVYSMIQLPRLGLPIIGATLKAAGHDAKIYNSNIAPIDWNDVNAADLVGISTTTSTVTEGYRFADQCRERGIPVIMGGSHVTFMADEALEHADFVARGEGGEKLMLELVAALESGGPFDAIKGLSFTRDGEAHAQRAARPVHRARRAAVPRPLADPRLRQHEDDADHDELGLPVPLQLLLGHRHVRPQVPVPQRRQHHRRAQGASAAQDLLLRRQPGRRQEAPQGVVPAHARRRHRRALVGADAHRRGARPRAARPHAPHRLLSRLPRPRVGQPGDSRRLRQAPERRRHRAGHPHSPRARHRVTRHVRAGRRHRHQAVGARHGQVRHEEPHRHDPARGAHAAARHARSTKSSTPPGASSRSAGISTTPSTWCSSRPT